MKRIGLMLLLLIAMPAAAYDNLYYHGDSRVAMHQSTWVCQAHNVHCYAQHGATLIGKEPVYFATINDVVVIELGGNDAVKDLSMAEHEQTLRDHVAYYEASGIAYYCPQVVRIRVFYNSSGEPGPISRRMGHVEKNARIDQVNQIRQTVCGDKYIPIDGLPFAQDRVHYINGQFIGWHAQVLNYITNN